MLFINHATDTKAAKDYFTEHLSRSDYYMRDAQEVVGEWHGRGAELLGLQGQVDKDSYFKLCENFDPITGEQLTPRTKTERRVLYDFTFDAPKSVTLAYELGGDERIRDLFRQSVAETMSDMENEMRVRVRASGADTDRPSANMIWGEFLHRTTRPVDGVPDPQLHIHAVAFNASFDPVEERWKAGQFEKLVQNKGLYQAAFHSRLAAKLAGIGYGIERDGKSFKLAGIDKATAQEFSRRTQLIDAEAKRLGLTDPKALRELGRRTREAKSAKPLSMPELRKLWKERLKDGEGDAIAGARAGQETRTLSAEKAVDYAIAHSFERASTITQEKFLETALIHSVGNASVEEIRAAAQRDEILQRDRGGRRYVTTRNVLSEEIAMTDFVRQGKATRARLGGDQPAKLDPALSDEQRAAAMVILQSQDKVIGLKGGAGTGKTRMMQATVAAIEKTGKKVFTFAPSAEASRGVLRSEGFANADTVERLLIDPEMQHKAHGQVLWIDEAGLLSVKDMKRLFDVAKNQNARVILSGDSAQHNAVIRGDALRTLEKDAGMSFATLKQIRRQTVAGYRDAVAAIAEGDEPGKSGKTKLQEGIEALDKMQGIVEAPGANRYMQIAEDYEAATSERKQGGVFKTALVVSPTHREAENVTQAIRETLKASGKVGLEDREFTSLRPRNLTEAERGDAANYLAGEVVQFHQNAKGFRRGERVTIKAYDRTGVSVTRADGGTSLLPLREAPKFQLYQPERLALAKGDKIRITQNGFTAESKRGLLGGKGKDRLNNGAVYDVAGFTKQGDIKLDNGFIVPKDYGGLAHGYVITSHASQGKTVDRVLIALGTESFTAANREQFYVSVSRGREGVKLYTDDKASMMEAVQGSSARLSASELMQDEKPKRTGSPMRREAAVQQNRRAYFAKRLRMAAYDLLKAEERKRIRGMDYAR